MNKSDTEDEGGERSSDDLDYDDTKKDDDVVRSNKRRRRRRGGGGKGSKKFAIKFIEDKTKRNLTFYKRRTGIMKKAYELATLTGAEVLVLSASETGHVYTFATPKLQPIVAKSEGKKLIQSCLNASDASDETLRLEQERRLMHDQFLQHYHTLPQRAPDNWLQRAQAQSQYPVHPSMASIPPFPFPYPYVLSLPLQLPATFPWLVNSNNKE